MKGLLTILAGSAALAMAACTAAQNPPPADPAKAGAQASDPAHHHEHGDHSHHHPPTPADGFEQNSGNDWFGKTRLDLGSYFEEETAVGHFEFENPRDVEHKLMNLVPSCTCAKAILRVGERTYELGHDRRLSRIVKNQDGTEVKEQVAHITVGPGEKGDVEVHMKMAGIRGQREADLRVQTSDEELPTLNLKWRATGAVFFEVVPPEINLNEMAWTDQREFEFRISSPLRKDFDLLSHEPLPEGMKVSYTKEMQGDRAVWVVKGTYGPGARETDQGGAITFNTNAEGKTVTARVIAFLKGPLTMKPGGFISLGHVSKSEGKEVEITLTPAGDFDLQVERLEVERLRIKDEQRDKVQFDHHKEGKDVVVTIRVAKGMEPAYLNGVLKIHLNHPAVRMKEVMFNGFVR